MKHTPAAGAKVTLQEVRLPAPRGLRAFACCQRPTLTPGARSRPLAQMNDVLDALAAAPNRDAKVKVLLPVLVKMDIEQIRWLCCIILKGARVVHIFAVVAWARAADSSCPRPHTRLQR